MMRTTPITVALLLCLAMLSSGMAQAPRANEDKDKLVLENEHVRVWFQGKKPMLKVFPADADEENESAAYGYHFMDLVEYNDVDGDGLPSNNEVVASLALHRANAWNVTREEGDGNVTLTLRLVAPVKLGRGVELPTENVTGNLTTPPGAQNADVTLVFRVHETSTTVETPEGNVTVPETSIKYDLVVDAWPFVNAELDRLALEVQVTGALETDGENATVVANGTEVGALSWVSTAVGNTTDGTSVEVPVRAATASASERASRLVFTYDAPDLASLVHDPTIGLASQGEGTEQAGADEASEPRSSVPGPAALLVGAVALGAALLVGRRR